MYFASSSPARSVVLSEIVASTSSRTGSFVLSSRRSALSRNRIRRKQWPCPCQAQSKKAGQGRSILADLSPDARRRVGGIASGTLRSQKDPASSQKEPPVLRRRTGSPVMNDCDEISYPQDRVDFVRRTNSAPLRSGDAELCGARPPAMARRRRGRRGPLYRAVQCTANQGLLSEGDLPSRVYIPF